MKRILNVLLLAFVMFAIGGIMMEVKALEPAAGEATVNVHFHKWDEKYENVKAWSWGKTAAVSPDETPVRVTKGGIFATKRDDFGLVFQFFVEAGNENPLGFIPLEAQFTAPTDNWDDGGPFKKLSGADILIPVEDLAAGDVLDVWVFEGSKGKDANADKGEVAYLVSKNSFNDGKDDVDAHNMILVYADVAGEYEENIGVHAWGDYDPAMNIKSQWGTPDKIFKTVGMTGTSPVLGSMITYAVGKTPGMLIYAGGDANKHTADLNPHKTLAADAPAGAVGLMYVMNAGPGVTTNKNVFYGETLADFYTELTAFRFDKGSYAQGKGTFAYRPTVINTLLNRVMNFGWTDAKTDEEKAAKEAEMIACYTIEEVTLKDDHTVNEIVKEIPIKGINFNRTVNETSEFILELAEANKLDNTKNYRVSFDRKIQNNTKEIQEVEAHNAKVNYGHEVTVNLTVTLGEMIDPTEHVYLVGTVNGWNPGDPTWKLVKDATNPKKFTISKTFYTYDNKMIFKFVAGDSWDHEELDAEGNGIPNRELVLDGATVTESMEIVDFKNISATASAKDPSALPAQDPEMVLKDIPAATYDELHAETILELDKEAPVITFLTEWDEDEGRVINVPLGSKWNPALFPTYTVTDDRDGDIGYKVYVPGAKEGNEYRILDTRTAGDYKILLKVVDDWGNVTEEIFTFRVK
ncbi:MAG: pullulanase-associated domain-containing protein [Acholeplasmataceae bacterium]|jgi:hypothetical protein